MKALTEDGRMSTTEVAEKVGLSATPCGRRIRHMEEIGVIEGYSARINPAALGLGLSVMVSVRLAQHGPEGHKQFSHAISEWPEVTECLLVTGGSDYLLRVWVADAVALREFITNNLQGVPCVAETSTMLVLSESRGTLARLA